MPHTFSLPSSLRSKFALMIFCLALLAGVVAMPAYGQSNSLVGLFRVDPGGHTAERVNVQLGRSSVNQVEILNGLKQGDVVILSDMSRWDAVDRVRIK